MFVGLVLIFLGVVFLLNTLDVFDFDLGKLWPVILIILGVAILAGRFSRRRHE